MKDSHACVQPHWLGGVERFDGCSQSLRVSHSRDQSREQQERDWAASSKGKTRRHWEIKCLPFGHILSQAARLWLRLINISFLPLKQLKTSIWQTSGLSLGALYTLFVIFCDKHLHSMYCILDFLLCLSTFDPVQSCHLNPTAVMWS